MLVKKHQHRRVTPILNIQEGQIATIPKSHITNQTSSPPLLGFFTNKDSSLFIARYEKCSMLVKKHQHRRMIPIVDNQEWQVVNNTKITHQKSYIPNYFISSAPKYFHNTPGILMPYSVWLFSNKLANIRGKARELPLRLCASCVLPAESLYLHLRRLVW